MLILSLFLWLACIFSSSLFTFQAISEHDNILHSHVKQQQRKPRCTFKNSEHQGLISILKEVL